VVCATAEHAERLVAALVANRRLARTELRLHAPARFGAAGAPGADLVVLDLDGLGDDLGALLACRELVLVATGAERADALHAALAAPADPAAPASLLRAHPRLTVVCDPPAAARLSGAERRAGDHVAIVLGHREPGVSVEHRISHESLERLQRAERLVQRRPARAVVLTGYTSTGGLSEAEQMGLRWNDTAVPCLLEVAGRDTAENATRSLPLVLALGGVRHVSVVTSAWHIRTPWFFAPYRRYGLDVDWAREWRGGSFAPMLGGELRKARAAPRERRRAWRSVGEVQA
jgi:hypothetical protein